MTKPQVLDRELRERVRAAVQGSLPNHADGGEVVFIADDDNDVLRLATMDGYIMRVGYLCEGHLDMVYAAVGQSPRECAMRILRAAIGNWKA